MGYSFKGVCYPDIATAAAAVSTDSSSLDSSGYVVLNGSACTSSGSTVTCTVKYAAWTKPSNTDTYSLVLPSCTEDMSQYSDGNLLMIFAFCFAAFAGFVAGFKR
jgi:hypothetical protein